MILYTKITSCLSMVIILFLVIMSAIFWLPHIAYAATSPSLGIASTFGVLSNTYTNVAAGTTINGDLGYITGPATAPTVVGGTTHVSDTTYTQAGASQGVALTNLSSQPCTYTSVGAIDLATDITHGTAGIYTPGVYCVTGNANIGGGGITLNGSGTYIFRVTGALTSANASIVTSNGASACDVWWTPTGATTLGTNSTFIGTDIDDLGITVGSTTAWTGRALAFAGTVVTTSDTITVPTCVAPTPTPTSTPIPTPTSTVTSSSNSSSGSSANSNSGSSSSTNAPGACTPSEIKGTPRIITSRRVSTTGVFISWGPYEGTNKFLVEYGFANGDWAYNTTVTGFSTTLNDLPVNRPIWVRVVPTDGCGLGNYSDPRLVGGPILPATGFDPTNATKSVFFSTSNSYLLFTIFMNLLI